MPCVAQNALATALQNVEGFLHVKVPVYGNASRRFDLLSAHREVVRSGGGARHDVDIAAVPKVDKVFTLGGVQHIALR